MQTRSSSSLAEPGPTATAPSDRIREVCRGVAAGEPAAITELYQAKFGLVLATARRITGRDEAFGLDAAQEVFLRVIGEGGALRNLDTDGDLNRWLVRITHSACIDLLRKEQRRARRERTRAAQATGDNALDPAADIDRLSRLLSKLNDNDRAMLNLRTRGYTLENLARVFGITTGAAHGRVRRTTQRLANDMRDSDRE